MNYYANYTGEITVQKDTLIKNGKFDKDFEGGKVYEALSAAFEEVNVEAAHGAEYISIFGHEDYKEDEIYAALVAVSPYVTEGVIDYTGEDGSLWKHEFKEGEWLEKTGYIEYSEGKAIAAPELDEPDR